jgi:hypothetical protein
MAHSREELKGNDVKAPPCLHNPKSKIYQENVLVYNLALGFSTKRFNLTPNFRGLSPCSNYTIANFRGQKAARGQRDESLGHILGFPDRNRHFLFQVAPQLYSRV